VSRHLLCASSDLAEGAHRMFEVDGQRLLVARLTDGLYAMQDTCPHRGASLSAGPLEGGVVTCHLHFWSFDIRSGASLQVQGLRQKTYVAGESEGKVYVEL
jgi:nitrite reductase/ring-hydroxylating ferredoxin subunit